MWNIFNRNKSKREKQRNLLISSLSTKSDADNLYKVFSLKPHTKNKSVEQPLPKGWNAASFGTTDFTDDFSWKYNVSGEYLKKGNLPTKYETLPNWVEQYPGFRPTAWIINTNTLINITINLVTYEGPPTIDEPDFAKVVFTVDNVPFKQMDNLCAYISKYNNDELQLHGLSVAKNYHIGEDGKIRDKTKQSPPNADSIHWAVKDLFILYEDWRRFPDVSDYNTMVKLSFALKSVEAMQMEEISGRTKKKIDEIRAKITTYQERIVELERDLNEVYEKAADALNLLEEHGFDLKKIEEMQGKPIDATSIDYSILNKLCGMGLSVNQ